MPASPTKRARRWPGRSSDVEGPRRRLRRPTLYEGVAITIALGGVAVVGSVAYATIPTDGVIYGCYSKSGGNLRVIDASVTKCGAKETSLSWNVEGAEGPEGPAGPQGPPGADGEDGAQGPAGISGYEVVTVIDRFISPFEPNRLDARAECPEGKKFLGGGYAFYLVPPGFAPQYTPPERVNALPQLSDTGDAYSVTVIHPIPQGNTAELKAVIACAFVNG